MRSILSWLLAWLHSGRRQSIETHAAPERLVYVSGTRPPTRDVPTYAMTLRERNAVRRLRSLSSPWTGPRGGEDARNSMNRRTLPAGRLR